MRKLGLATVLAVSVISARTASAAPLLVNGGFESGLTGWTLMDQVGGSGGSFLQSGTASPLNGFAVPAPPQGTFAIMTDQGGPGSHIFFQDFVVPVGTNSAELSFQYFLHNYATDYFTRDTLDFTGAANQQARVDIMLIGANPFSVAPGDILFSDRTSPGNDLIDGYTTNTYNLSAILAAHAGQTLRLRFAEVDNQSNFNLGIDNVRLNATTVPEPGTLLLIGTGLAAAVRRAKRRA